MKALILLLLALGLVTFGCCCAMSDLAEGDYSYDDEYYYESDAPVINEISN
ncbi:hypothetical protein KKB44_01595 [Candidatus Micrarchaeota archaeon]|nr:hypothetical protein [Candidatus Micrarchaeota archaeon]